MQDMAILQISGLRQVDGLVSLDFYSVQGRHAQCTRRVQARVVGQVDWLPNYFIRRKFAL